MSGRFATDKALQMNTGKQRTGSGKHETCRRTNGTSLLRCPFLCFLRLIVGGACWSFFFVDCAYVLLQENRV